MHNPSDVKINSSGKYVELITFYLDNLQGFSFLIPQKSSEIGKSVSCQLAKKFISLEWSLFRLKDEKTEIVTQEWIHMMGILKLFLSSRYFPSHSQ